MVCKNCGNFLDYQNAELIRTDLNVLSNTVTIRFRVHCNVCDNDMIINREYLFDCQNAEWDD